MNLIAARDIDLAFLEELVADRVQEGSHLDYKLEINTEDTEKFLIDVVAFANSGGGNIIYGLAEDKNARASKVMGLKGVKSDLESRRLFQLIERWISPRIPDIEIKSFDVEPGLPIIVVHVPHSWLSPHMVSFNENTLFKGRAGSHNFVMDVEQIRTAFNMAEDLPRRMQKFRDGRVASIRLGHGFVRLGGHGIVIVHIIPISSMTGKSQAHARDLMTHSENFSLFGEASNRARYNSSGVLRSRFPDPEEDYGAYAQYYRSGIIEAVDTYLLRYDTREPVARGRDGRYPVRSDKSFSPMKMETAIIKVTMQSLEFLRNCDVSGVAYVYVTLCGLEGHILLKEGLAARCKSPAASISS